MEIQILHQQGLSQRKIAQQLGLSRHTVKRYLDYNKTVPTYSPRAKVASILDPYKAYLHQ